MVELTLLELHVHDGVDFSPRGVIGDDEATALTEETSETNDRTDTDAASDRPSLLRRSARTAIGIAAVAGAAYVVRRRRAADEEETDVEVEIEESEAVAE